MLKALEGFHHRVARRIAGMMPRYIPAEDRWEYPPIAGALERAGLKPMASYIEARRNNLAEQIALRPIRELLEEMEWQPGSAQRKLWTDLV